MAAVTLTVQVIRSTPTHCLGLYRTMAVRHLLTRCYLAARRSTQVTRTSLRHLSTISAAQATLALEMAASTSALSRCRLVRLRRLPQGPLLRRGLVPARGRALLLRRVPFPCHLRRRHVLLPGRGPAP